jgi:hypothetical protein
MLRKTFENKTIKFGLNLTIIYGFLVCLIAGIIVAYNSPDGYGWLFLIPVFFGIYFFIFPGVIRYVDMSPGILLICFVSFLRYVLSPLLTAVSGVYWISSGYAVLEPIYFDKAIILTFYEMTCIMFAIFLFKSRCRYSVKNINFKSEYIFNNEVPVIALLVIVAVLLLIIKPSLLNNYNFFIVDEDITVAKYGEYGTGIEIILIEVARYTLPLIFLPYFYRKYLNTKRTRYIIYSIIPVLVTISFFTRTSRGSVLVPGVTYLFLLTSLYKEKSKAIFTGLSAFLFFVLGSITLFKSFGLSSSESSFSAFSIEWFENFLQVYFAGVKNVAVAIKANEVFNSKISLSTLLSDLLRNFPGVGHLVKDIDTSTIYFNLVYYSGTHIFDNVIPTVGQGIMYLGYILSTTFSVIFVIIALKCDELYKSEKKVEYAFLFALIAVNFGNNHIANIQLLAAFVTNWVIPLIILFKLNEYVIRFLRKEVSVK